MSYVALAAGIVGAGASVAGVGITAANQPSPPGAGALRDTLGLEAQFKPAAYSAALSGLEGQNAYGVGASPDQIALELVTRQLEQSSNANVARKFEKFYSNLQALAQITASGGTLTPKQQNQYNDYLDRANRILTARGGGATLNIDAGGAPSLLLTDPAQRQLVEAARQNYQSINANRQTAQQNLSKLAADFPQASATDLQNLIQQYQTQISGEVNNTYDQATENALQLANTRGYNPAGQVGLLDQQRVRDLLAIPTTAADRALQILGGKQQLAMGSIAGTNAALSPDSTIAIMNALRGQQTPTTGQLAAAQLAAGTSARNTGANNLTGSIGQAVNGVSNSALLSGLLYGSRPQTSQNLGPGASVNDTALESLWQ